MSQDPEQPPEIPLPALRQDLQILPGVQDRNGAPGWLLFDPVANIFHELSERAFILLSHWKPVPPSIFLTHFATDNDYDFTREDLEEMTGFLYAKKLTNVPAGLMVDDLVAQEMAANPPFYKTIFHKYLFFRVPLVRPQRFLHRFYPFIRPLYSRVFTWITIISGLIGIWLVLEQWDSFKTTFLHFLTFEGLLYYGLTLAGLKILHELGHAFMAYRYGCRVPTIGVAFLVMFPIMYTDTTDAYRLTSRRKRVMIDAAGMLVELTIACFALLAWSFLPEGAAKSAAFFIATTSWILSLTVNLNPLMRFDGYYLFSDALGQRNLQERGFALAKWKLREILFGLNHEIPIDVTKREKWILLVYAYCTWVYRFFLFLGIALLVHALFPKALGIILFSVEILFFIITPIFKEILIWWSLRMDILKSFKARINLVGLTAICIAMVLPLRTTIHAPALIRPSVSTDIYPKAAGLVTQIHVTPGAQVKSGQVLVTLSNDRLSYEITNTQLRAELLAAQLARRSSDKTDLADSTVLRQRLTRERAHLKGLRAEQDNLVIRAPHDGVFAQVHPDLHIGRFISPSFPIASLIDSRTYEILALVPEKNVARIKEQSSARFIGSNWDGARLKARVHTIAPTAEERLNEPVFSSNYRGPIAVKPDQNGEDTPVEAVLRVLLTPEQTGAFNRAERGVVIFPATPESLAKAIWRHISHVFIREIDF